MKNVYVAPGAEEFVLPSEEILLDSPESNDNEGNLGDLLGSIGF